jgi:hypothetical protein
MAAVMVCALPSSTRAEDLYRWHDPQGRVHWGTVPAVGATDVERIDPAAGKGTLTVVPSAAPAPAPIRPGPRTRPGAETDAARRLRQLEEQEPTVIAGKREADWRSQALDHESHLRSLREQLEKAEYELSNAYALGRAARYQRRVDSLKSQLEAAEQSMDDFEDRARELGVPPGWLR